MTLCCRQYLPWQKAKDMQPSCKMSDTRIKSIWNFHLMKFYKRMSFTSRCRHPYVVKMSMIPKKYLFNQISESPTIWKENWVICFFVNFNQLDISNDVYVLKWINAGEVCLNSLSCSKDFARDFMKNLSGRSQSSITLCQDHPAHEWHFLFRSTLCNLCAVMSQKI